MSPGRLESAVAKNNLRRAERLTPYILISSFDSIKNNRTIFSTGMLLKRRLRFYHPKEILTGISFANTQPFKNSIRIDSCDLPFVGFHWTPHKAIETLCI